MNVFITTSNKYFELAKKQSVFFAKHLGRFDKCVVYDNDNTIDLDFYNNNKEILSIKKGAGLWLWKPYFIKKALVEECEVGDFLFYLDAGGFFIRNANKIISKIKDDFFVCEVPYIEEEFTKCETFIGMGLTDDKYKKTRQIQASFMAFRKNERTIRFVDEWLNYCTHIDLLSDNHNFENQIANFVGHRMDQSIFSLLCKKYNIKSYYDPTQYGILGYRPVLANTYMKIETKKKYPVTILLHRKPKAELIWVMLTLLWINTPKFIRKFRNKYIRHENR